MNKLEAAAYMGAGLVLGLGVMATTQVGEPQKQPLRLSTPLDGPGISGEECLSSLQLLKSYLLEGFQRSTGFDWMKAKKVSPEKIVVLAACPEPFQGTVVEEQGINVRRIPYNNNAWLVGALTWGEEITFSHIVFVGKELWGVRGAGNDFEFFIIRGKNGAEFVKVKNMPKSPEEPSPDNGNFGQDQGGFPYGRHPWAKQLEEKQPPNPSMARAGGRVFIA